jgi:hypothetical protein
MAKRRVNIKRKRCAKAAVTKRKCKCTKKHKKVVKKKSQKGGFFSLLSTTPSMSKAQKNVERTMQLILPHLKLAADRFKQQQQQQ